MIWAPYTRRRPASSWPRIPIWSAPPTRRSFAASGWSRRDGATGSGRGAPDLAAEVISPSDTYGEVDEKVCDWLDAGTRLVVVVDPRTGTVTSYRSRTEIRMLTGDDVLDGGDVVPGWKLPVRDLFR